MQLEDNNATDENAALRDDKVALVQLRTVIRTAAERDFVLTLRPNLRRIIGALVRQHGNQSSLLVESFITRLQALHDELAGLIKLHNDKQYLKRTTAIAAVDDLTAIAAVDALNGLPAKLIGLRVEKGITYAELANRTGIARTTLMHHEKTYYQSAALKQVNFVLRVLSEW